MHTVIPPDPRKRAELMNILQADDAAVTRHRERRPSTDTPPRGTGGWLTQEQARQRQDSDIRRSAYQMQMDRERREKETREREDREAAEYRRAQQAKEAERKRSEQRLAERARTEARAAREQFFSPRAPATTRVSRVPPSSSAAAAPSRASGSSAVAPSSIRAPAAAATAAPPSSSTRKPRPASTSAAAAAPAAPVDETRSMILNEFKCPLTHRKFRDPVVAADGFSYERRAIEDLWRTLGESVSPATGEPIPDTLVPNRALQNLLGLLLSRHPQARVDGDDDGNHN
jgi:hypothetical protein